MVSWCGPVTVGIPPWLSEALFNAFPLATGKEKTRDRSMPSTKEPLFGRPCLILTHGNPQYLADTCKFFRRQGWDVYEAQSGPETRRLARMLEPDLVVLEADLAEESGWLTCAKLTGERPGSKVVLISDDVDQHNRGMAAFVGAATLLRRQDSLASLLKTPAAMRPAA
jgi:CheY-like chemotaxis protein